MKTPILIISLVFGFLTQSIAQVGISTTSPNSQLDIRSSNQSNPANNDGILIPKIDNFPSSNPTVNQDGMMVFVTGSGVPNKGFYYWDDSTTSWQTMKGAKKINELEDGKSDNDGSQDGSSIFLGVNAGLNDDLTDNRNLGIGFQSLLNNTTGNNNIALGFVSLENTLTGIGNVAIGNYTLRNLITGNSNVAIGYYSQYSNSNGFGNVSLGGGSSRFNTTGNNNTAIGTDALRFNTVSSNTAIGSQSLRNNTSGINNVGVGSRSLYSNLTGSYNTAIGGDALRFNTVSSNTAIGSRSLYSNLTGSSNTAVGTNGLFANTTGRGNTAMGSSALAANTYGYDNTAVGFNTLGSNVSGIGNIAVGANALSSNTSGNSNIGIGHSSLGNNTLGSGNVSVGFENMRFNNGGSNNVSLGASTLYQNTTGTNNTVLGAFAGYSNSTGGYNIFLGSQAGYNETGSNKLYIENTNATDTGALIYGDFSTDFLRLNAETEINGRTEITTTLDASGTSGTGALEIANTLRLDGDEIITDTNTTLFVQADNNGDLDVDSATLRVDASSNRVGIGTSTPNYTLSVNGVLNLSEGIGSGIAMRVNGSEALWYNGTYFSWGFGGSANFFADNVGIGVSNPNVALDVIGSIEYTGTITDVSDRRLKENFEPISDVLQRLQKVSGYSYNMIDDETKTREYGVVAQELQAVFPEMVSIVDLEEGYLGVSYIQLIPVLLEAIKEQQYSIQQLKKELVSKSEFSANIERRLEKLETFYKGY